MHDEVRRWLSGDPTAKPPKKPASVLADVENDHLQSILQEYGRESVRELRRRADAPVDPEVIPRRVDGPERCTVTELLKVHPRVLVVGGRGSGKTALMAHLAVTLANQVRDEAIAPVPSTSMAPVPFMVPVPLLPEPRLDEETLGRLSPIGGVMLVRTALAEQRAAVLVDGLDEAEWGATALSESIQAFTRAYPSCPVVVTTRPRRTGIAGFTRVDMPGFVTATLMPPRASRVVAAHRFLARRYPERRTALVAGEVETLLRRWSAAELPAGSALGSLDLREKLILFGRVAQDMHMDRVVESPEATLRETIAKPLQGVRCIGGERLVLDKFDEDDIHDSERDYLVLKRTPPPTPVEGEPVHDIEGLIDRIVREIRLRPGLLVERRPGVFAFPDLVFQEYLTARETIRTAFMDRFIELRGDPWWHNVIVLAAADPEVDACDLVTDLVETDWKLAVTTLLAARCVEAAGARIPERLARKVAGRLSEVVPPQSELDVDRLVEAGDLAVPALLKALDAADPDERALTALALGRLNHAPAYGVLVRLAADNARTRHTIHVPIWTRDRFLRNRPVALFALSAVFNLAIASPGVRRPFDQALERVSRSVLKPFYTLVDRMYMFAEQDDAPRREIEEVYVLLAKMSSALEKPARKTR